MIITNDTTTWQIAEMMSDEMDGRADAAYLAQFPKSPRVSITTESMMIAIENAKKAPTANSRCRCLVAFLAGYFECESPDVAAAMDALREDGNHRSNP